ncbi:MAG TPA: branched-chain amino acid ABC transporter substrate-binding protein [Gemmata sp.]|nr:branched-chain amino acid ABC transporter substrate-binding protein [Gemmata sp.]
MNRREFLALTAGTAVLPNVVAEEKKTIKLVSSLPRTGSAKGQTDTIVNGIRMAIDEYRKQLPFEIEYEDFDDATPAMGQWDPIAEKQNAEKAVKDEDVMAMIGPYNSGAAKVSMPILNEAGLVQITPAATWPGLSKKTKWSDPKEPDIYRPAKTITFCRVCPTDDTQGQLTAAFAANDLKAKSVYVLDDGEHYGQMCATTFAAECKKQGIKLLGQESIDILAKDYRALMAKVKKTDPDAVYFGGTTQSKAPDIAKDFTASGMKCPLILPDGCYENVFIEVAGADNVNGRCFVTIGGVDISQLTGHGAAFVKKYKARHAAEPEAYAVYGYEAALVILEAIKGVGKKDREAIRKAVVGTKNFDKGILGKWSFDANGDTTLQQITVSKIEDGKFVPMKVVTADPAK